MYIERVCASMLPKKKWNNEQTSSFVLSWKNRPQKYTKWINMYMVTILWAVCKYLSEFQSFKFEKRWAKRIIDQVVHVQVEMWKMCSIYNCQCHLWLVFSAKKSCNNIWNECGGSTTVSTTHHTLQIYPSPSQTTFYFQSLNWRRRGISKCL